MKYTKGDKKTNPPTKKHKSLSIAMGLVQQGLNKKNVRIQDAARPKKKGNE